MAAIDIEPYTIEKENEWDRFIREEACNATFLQTRKFLNYHPEGKYADCSLLFYRKGRLVGVCPACITSEKGIKTFSSHPGSTYGGIIVSREMHRAERMLELIDVMEVHLKERDYGRCVLKQNNPLMDVVPMDLLEFCLYFRGYVEYKELDIYIDYDAYGTDQIVSNFSKLKKRQIKKCIESDMELRQLSGQEDMREFIRILGANLQKYGLTPYHTPEDLTELKRRFPDEIQFWGAVHEGKILAESMVFLFARSGCAHTHYLAADPAYSSMSPMTFIYYSMIEQYAKEGYRANNSFYKNRRNRCNGI